MAQIYNVYFLDPRLQTFFANADFGEPQHTEILLHLGEQCVVDPGRLQDYIPTIVIDGVITGHIALLLFKIYLQHHRLHSNNDPKLWYSNQEMDHYLGETLREFARIERNNTAYLLQMGEEPRPLLFTQDGISPEVLDLLVKTLRSDSDLSEADGIFLNDPPMLHNLLAEQQVIEQYLVCLYKFERDQRKRARDRFLEDRKHQALRAWVNVRVPSSSRSSTGDQK
jgi:hypothetical protein